MDELESLDDVADIAKTSVSGLVADLIAHLPFLFAGIVVLLLTWAASTFLANFLPRLLGRWHKRESLKELAVRMSMIALWLLGFMLAAVIVFPGVTPSKVIGGLGIASIAVGLAFKDIFENFFAGILLLLRFPFEKGDFIECEGIVGKVDRVLFRMTYIRKTTGELVVVPNAFLFKNPVEVLTEQPQRRVTLMTGVSYDTDVDDALPRLDAAVKSCDSVAQDRPVQIFAQGFGSSSIDIEVAWWTGSTPFDIRHSRSEVVLAIKRTLDEAGIEIPFPYRTLTFKEPLPIERSQES